MIQNEPMKLIANRYDVLEELGQGGMGTVYRVHDRLNGEKVALKRVLTNSEQLQHNSVSNTADPMVNLANEFKTLASLRHPNIISVLDYGFDTSDGDQQPFFTMTLVDNPRTILEAASGKSLAEQTQLVVQMLQALAYLHRRGIIHRDLKPGNVLTRDDTVYVLDFGLAIQHDQDKVETAGTLAYLAPEVLRGAPASAASDLYAVGIIMHEIVAGFHPYNTDSVSELIQSLLTRTVDVSNLPVSDGLKIVLMNLLEKDPELRYNDVQVAINDLCQAVGLPIPEETQSIRDSFLQAAHFVGREIETEILSEALKTTVNTHGSGWLIGGESGVGKTRLMDELRTRALVDGVLVLRGQAVTESGLPYQLWRDALRRLVLCVEINDEEAEILRTIVPDVERLIGRAIPKKTSTAMKTTDERLQLLISDLFMRASQIQPLLLLLEDLQWAAPKGDNLKMLQRLTPLATSTRLMIIGNYRNDEAPDLPENFGDLHLIQLTRLHQGEIARLSASMLGKSGEQPDVVNLLQQESEGNVFFLIEVVRALAMEAGSLSEIGQVTLPTRIFAGGIQRIVQHRIEQVPAWARAPLQFAAIAGRQINIDLVQHNVPDLDIEAWITVCVNAAVFELIEGTARFAHDKLREAVLDDLPEERAITLHRQVAQAMEAVFADHLDDYAVVLFDHWRAAQDKRQQAHYIIPAAKELHHRYDFHGANDILMYVLNNEIYTLADDPKRTLADIKFYIGRVTYGLSDYKAVKVWQEQALALYRELDFKFGIVEAIAALGEAEFRMGDFKDARPKVEESLRLYEELDLQDKVAYAYLSLGVIEGRSGSPRIANDYFQRGYDIMRQFGDQVAIARALNNLAISHDMMGEKDTARAIYERSLAIRREINDRQGIAYSLYNMGMIDEEAGDLERARSKIQESLEILRQIGEKMSIAGALSGLGDLERKLKNYEISRRYQQESLAIRREIGAKGDIVTSLKLMGDLAHDEGNLTETWRNYKEALELAQTADMHTRTIGLFRSISKLLATEGQPADALALLIYVRDENRRLDFPVEKIEKEIAELSAKLTEAQRADAQQRGEGLNLEQAIALAKPH